MVRKIFHSMVIVHGVCSLCISRWNMFGLNQRTALNARFCPHIPRPMLEDQLLVTECRRWIWKWNFLVENNADEWGNWSIINEYASGSSGIKSWSSEIILISSKTTKRKRANEKKVFELKMLKWEKKYWKFWRILIMCQNEFDSNNVN